MAGALPLLNLCTIHPARWAGLGKQPGSLPLKSVKTIPSWRTSEHSKYVCFKSVVWTAVAVPPRQAAKALLPER